MVRVVVAVVLIPAMGDAFAAVASTGVVLAVLHHLLGVGASAAVVAADAEGVVAYLVVELAAVHIAAAALVETESWVVGVLELAVLVVA